MRVQSPIVGNIVGSSGELVFQHYNGRTYARSKPVIFHYQPTPAQYAAQNKYYRIRNQTNPIYTTIKRYIPQDLYKEVNPANALTKGIFSALATFTGTNQLNLPTRFGFDIYDRFQLRLGNYQLYYKAPFYYITFWDFQFSSKVQFAPIYAHALYLCPDLQEAMYWIGFFNAEHLTFAFPDSLRWFPDHSFNMYVALSDENYFTNFFF